MAFLYYVLLWVGLNAVIYSTNQPDLELWARALSILPLAAWLFWTWERSQKMKERLDVLERQISERRERK